jgi:TolB protein
MATPRTHLVVTLLVLAGAAATLLLVLVASGKPVQAASSDPGKITFVRGAVCLDPDDHYCNDVYIMNPDGSSVTKVTTDGWNLHGPMLSPNGRKVAFEGYRAPLRVINTDGSGIHSVGPLPSFSAAWSPDGTKVAFVADAGHGYYYDFENPDIFVANADGNGQPLDVTNTLTGDENNPAFSPDGTKLAYSCGSCPGSTGRDVYVRRADGSGKPKQITSTSGLRERQLRWSPDGKKIAFTALFDSSPSRIYVMNADGSGMRPLAAEPSGSQDFPSWSPDGRQLIFNRGGDIYRVDADGTNPVKVNDDDLGYSEASWQPNSAPFVKPLSPLPGSTTTDRTPSIFATVRDVQDELTQSDVTRLSLDGQTIGPTAFAYDPSTDRLSYTPSSALSYGRHTMRVAAKDSMGATSTKAWSFVVVPW